MNMKIFLLSIVPVLALLFLPQRSSTFNYPEPASYSKDKFFIKTKYDLKISEATGKISLSTGINSLDEKIIKYKVIGIDNVFKLNNGSREIYEKYEMSRIYVLSILNPQENVNTDIEEIVNDFSEDVNIEFSEPNYTGSSAGVKEIAMKNFFLNNMPNDEMFSKQWYLQNNGSVDPSSSGSLAKVGADIKILSTWQIETGNEEVIVAILDSGIKDDHPDLKDRMWINKNEIPGNGIDDDYNGYVDDYKGWDFAYDDRKPEDGFGHGTNIATVIGASTNNQVGFAGIDQKCKLMNCKNLNAENTGEYGWWAESIKYATDNGARIINMSEGGDDYSKVLRTAINYAVDNDVLITSAMMNKGDNRDYYPASYKGVFAVGATDTDDKRCKRFSWGGGSCWGKHISVVAPGNKIYGLDYENPDNYDVYWSGTSQSTAIVSGIAALLLSQDNLRTSEDLKRIIKLSSKDLVGDIKEDRAGWDQFYGYGRVDSYSALTFEKNNNLLKDDASPIEEINENIIKDTTEIKNDTGLPSKAKKEAKPAKADEKNSDNESDK
ncbi:MAG: S8 family serine peptidase [Bacteroidota bacterium]|nr:S8 family serine peptidase [Bacteroidota bacterium]